MGCVLWMVECGTLVLQGALFYRGEVCTTWFWVKEKCTVVMSAGDIGFDATQRMKLFKSSWFSYRPKQKGVWLYKLSIHFHNGWADICQILTAICSKRYINKTLHKGTFLFQIQPFLILEGEKGALIFFHLPSHFAADKFWVMESLLCSHCRHQISTASGYQGKLCSCRAATF